MSFDGQDSGPYGGLHRAEQKIANEQAWADHQNLVREAERADGGTPTQKLWRRLKRALGRSSGD